MSNKEKNVFTEHYSIFCDTLMDIDNLLKYFVQEKIIKSEDQDEINALVKKTEKVQKLLKHIAGPLEAGDSKGFYTMLDIMENHGVQATKDLAASLKTVLSKDISKSPEFSKQENVSAILQKSTNHLSAQFSSLLRTVESVLDKSSKNLEICKRLCLDFKISDNSNVPLFNHEELKKISKCKSFKQLFTLLSQHWGWKEYCILEHIISASESKEAEDELEKYKKIMGSYFGLQLIADNFSPNELPDKYIKMTIIVEKPYKYLTLKDFVELRDFIFSQMDVRPYIAHPFIKFLFSSLHLEWYILQQAAPHMVEMSYKNIEHLKEYSIVYIKIDEKIILDAYKVKHDIEIHGLTLTFIELLPCELVCNLCKLPCKNPQISLCCKNRFCEGHLKQTSSMLIANQCPMCYSEKFETFPDTQADKTIQALMVYCPNKDAGCSWVGKVNQVSEHCNSDQVGCLFQEIKCPSNCGMSLQRKDLENHLMADCPRYCQYCKTTGDEILIAEQHKENCQMFPVHCPNGCGVTIFQESINEHRKVCPLEEIQCEYQSVGCKGIMLRKNKEEHNKYNAIKHLDLWKQNISYTTSCSHLLPYILILLSFALALCTYIINMNYEMESKYREIESKHHEMEQEYFELHSALLNHKMEFETNATLNHEMKLKYDEMDHKYHTMNAKLSQQLDELKKENRKLKINISNKHETFKKTVMTQLKDLKSKVNEYATSEEVQNFNGLLQSAYKFKETADEQTEVVNKQTDSISKLENTMNNNYRNLTAKVNDQTEHLNKLEKMLNKSFRNLSATIDHRNKQILSDIWHIHLSILRLLALHDNQVVPVVLVISNYSEWVKENETWHSPFFMDTRHGNQFYLSVKPVKTELSIHLHLATHSKKYGLHSGIFIIEVLNLISDSKHSVGKIHFSNATSFASDAKLLERKIVGNLSHSIPPYQKNAIYILRDELFLRVSFISDK